MTEYFLEDDELFIPYLNKYSSHFLGKNVLICGGSESGKTTLVNDIVKKLTNDVPVVVRFSHDCSNDLDEKVERLQGEYNMRLTIENLSKLIEHQKKCMRIHSITNNIDLLNSICLKTNDEKFNTIVEMVNQDAERFSKLADTQYKDPGLRHAEKTKIKTMQQSTLKTLYRNCIDTHKESLLSQTLSSEELIAINYTNLNSNLVCIFDECEQFLREHQKDSVLMDIIFSGRVHNMTRIFTYQCDRHIYPVIRRAMDALIFTTFQDAMSHFNTASNAYDRQTRNLAERVIARIFKVENGIRTYRKLAFLPHSESSKFNCILAGDDLLF